jgi:tellurite resistance protein
MKPNPLGSRGFVLEQAFFNKLQEEQLARIRAESNRREERRALGAALEIEDESLLDALLDLGVTADTASAFEALPLVEVAWADGDVESQERWRVLTLATAFGLELGRSAQAQLELWLTHRPEPELFEAWYRFASGGLAGPAAASRARRVLEGAVEVAKAGGGVFGLWTVSTSERSAIDRIGRALGSPSPRPDLN